MSVLFRVFGFASVVTLTSAVSAGEVIDDFEDLAEGFYGEPFTHQGITYSELNNVSGVFPSGEQFGPELGDEVVIEDATLFYVDHPDWGSADKTLTFGNAFVPGDNLSLGRLSTVMMDLDAVASSIAMDIAYYENGPWGGISFHLDAMMDGNVVGSDTVTLADGGGRDSIGVSVLSIDGVEFDQLHFYARYGDEYSLPRVIVDDITVDYAGGGLALSIVGECPGTVELQATGATPGGTVAFAYAFNTGAVVVPSGPCAGTALGLDRSARLVTTARADAAGVATFAGNAPAAGCGGFIQAVNASDCATSSVEQL